MADETIATTTPTRPWSNAKRMSLRTPLLGQFKKPHGALGRVAGKIMTWRRSNRQRNRWTVVLLGIEPGDDFFGIGGFRLWYAVFGEKIRDG